MSSAEQPKNILDFIAQQQALLISSGLPIDGFENNRAVSPVALITYDGQKKGVCVGIDGENKFMAVESNLPAGFSPNSFIGWKSRVILLDHLHGLTVGQLGYGEVGVKRSPSLMSGDLVEAEIGFEEATHVEERGSQRLIVPIKDMVRFMASGGRIGVFNGGGMSEDNAVVLESALNGQRFGHVLFTRPSGLDKGITGVDPLTGLYAFYHGLNEGVIDHALSRNVREWVDILGDNIDKKYFQFEDDARLEIFRSVVIANIYGLNTAKGADKERHLEWLKNHLIIQSKVSKLLWGDPEKEEVDKLNAQANDLVDGVIIKNPDYPVISAAPVVSVKTEKKPLIQVAEGAALSRLRSGTVRDLRHILRDADGRFEDFVDNLFRENNTEWYRMGKYLDALFNFIPIAVSRAEVSDLEILIQELRLWPTSSEKVWEYEIHNDPATHLPIISFGSWHDPQTLDSFLNEAEKRLREIKKGS